MQVLHTQQSVMLGKTRSERLYLGLDSDSDEPWDERGSADPDGPPRRFSSECCGRLSRSVPSGSFR